MLCFPAVSVNIVKKMPFPTHAVFSSKAKSLAVPSASLAAG